MRIQRTETFANSTFDSEISFDWRDHYDLQLLKDRHSSWEFRETDDAYRFVDPYRHLVKDYKFDGSITLVQINPE